MEATGYSRGWIQQLAVTTPMDQRHLEDRRHRNPGATDRALLSAEHREELAQALTKPPPDGGMWNPRKVGQWIEQKTGKAVGNKKQRGREYLKRLRQSPKVPGPHHQKADERKQEAFIKKGSR
jgi:transposase